MKLQTKQLALFLLFALIPLAVIFIQLYQIADSYLLLLLCVLIAGLASTSLLYLMNQAQRKKHLRKKLNIMLPWTAIILGYAGLILLLLRLLGVL